MLRNFGLRRIVLALATVVPIAGCRDDQVALDRGAGAPPKADLVIILAPGPDPADGSLATPAPPRAREALAGPVGDPVPSGVAALEDALQDPDPVVRLQAVQEVEPTPASTAPLLDALRDPDPRVRAAVADGLAFLEPADVRGGVVWALSDADPAVVLAGIRALEIVGSADEVGALRALAVRGDPAVRGRAADAAMHLETMGRESAEAGGGG